MLKESASEYLQEEILEESISKTLKPVMNKMKKLKIGLPYRDARLFFFQFLKDKHPELVPDGFGRRKPSAKDVNALVGQIAIEKPEALDKFEKEFADYAVEKVPGTDEDRVSQFLRVAMILRTGKGVRPKGSDQGFVKKEYSGLTAQEIKNATMDAIEKAPVDKGEDADVQDEKLLLKASFAKVLAQMEQTGDIDPKILENIINVGSKIDTISKFKKFLDYMHQYEEYHVAEKYLRGMLEVIEKSLSEMGENEEELDDFMTGPQVEESPDFQDFEDMMDGKFPTSAPKVVPPKMVLRAAEKVAEALSQLEGQEFKIHDGSIDESGFDLDTEKEGAYAGGSYTVNEDGSIVNDALPHKPVYGFVNDSVDDIMETIRKLNLKPEDAEIDVKKADLNKDGKLSGYEKKRGQAIADAMEDDKKEEEEDDRISSYLKLQKAKDNMPKISQDDKEEKKEEDEQVALSPQEIARRMHDQRMSELQNFYQHERQNRYGY
jgi:hypothetical protein